MLTRDLSTSEGLCAVVEWLSKDVRGSRVQNCAGLSANSFLKLFQRSFLWPQSFLFICGIISLCIIYTFIIHVYVYACMYIIYTKIKNFKWFYHKSLKTLKEYIVLLLLLLFNYCSRNQIWSLVYMRHCIILPKFPARRKIYWIWFRHCTMYAHITWHHTSMPAFKSCIFIY